MQARKLAQQPEAILGEHDQDKVAHLRAVSLFEDLRSLEGALEMLSDCLERRVFAPGDAMITEGQPGNELFVLTRGEASVYKSTAEGEPYKVAILSGKNHAFFGEGGILADEARSATIRADGDCECLVLSRAGFERYSRAYPQWAFPILLKIARAVMSRLRNSNKDLMLLYNALVAEIRGQ